MKMLYKNPQMWEVDSLDDMLACLRTHPDAILIVQPRPRVAKLKWAELADDLIPRATGNHRLHMYVNRLVGNRLKEELAEVGVHSDHPLFKDMVYDFAHAHQALIRHFGARQYWNIKHSMICYLTESQESHNTFKASGNINKFHSDLPDWRLVCCYYGSQNTGYIIPAQVKRWYLDDGGDYPIWVAEPKFGTRIHSLPMQAFALYRGGPTPGRIPSYKSDDYVADMALRLPHASPVLGPDDAAKRIYMAANYYLRD